jgi:uncharacterized protein YkwD
VTSGHEARATDVKTFSAKTLLKKRTAAIAVAAIFAIGLSACGLPNSSSGPPTTDPYLVNLFNAVNYDRMSAGLPAFTWSPKLSNNAGNWAWQMAHDNSLHHQNLAYLLTDPSYVVFRTLGENILVGPGNMSANSVEGAWRSSPPHWANISSRAFNLVGIGYWRDPDGRLWAAQEFAGT